MRGSIALFLILATPAATAATRIWPGAAPCDGTLQACLSDSATNDTVEVATDGLIDESLTLDKSLTLRAGIGYAPRLAADRDIVAASVTAAPFHVTLEGFRLLRGRVLFVHSQPFAASVRIARTTIDAVPAGQIGIEVRGVADAPLAADFTTIASPPPAPRRRSRPPGRSTAAAPSARA